MVEAYVLVQTAVGRTGDVVRALEDLHGVMLAEGVTGPYDVVARVQAATIDDLGSLISAQIPAVPGITRTLTCTIMLR